MRTTGGQVRHGRGARMLAAVVAVAAVGLAAVAPGLPGAPGVPGASAATTGTPAIDDAGLAARSLLAMVPFGVRATCVVGDATAVSQSHTYGPAAAALAATLSCSPDRVHDAYYDQFRDAASMQAAFDYGFPAPQPSDRFDECPTRADYESGSTSAGVVACFIEGTDDGGIDDGVDPGTAVLAFTYAPANMIVWAVDDDVDAVWSFFEDDAGPLAHPDYDEIAPVPTADDLLDAARALGTHLPKAARRTCIPVTALDPEHLQTLFGYRLVIVADVEECQFRGGIEAEYVQLASRASVDYLMSRYDFTGRKVAKHKTFSCPGNGRYKGGQWGCYFSNYDADAQTSADEYATVVWSDDRLRTYSYGTALAADAVRLLQWFVNEAGPNA